tara:strand:- start:86 stop:256 length:171 start_codon:yes stop_codon:yes gene_type:complete
MEKQMKLTNQMIGIVDKLCGESDTFSLEVQDDLIKLATLMQKEKKRTWVKTLRTSK